jgi:hypothetical protein
MRPERITIDEVLEIFADYLEQAKNFEVVKTTKMGMLTVWDASEEKDRSFLSVEPVQDVDDLIQQILWIEISDCYYSEDHDMLDPCDCDETVETLVYSRMKPRLEKLPRKWDGLLEEFFADPDRHN